MLLSEIQARPELAPPIKTFGGDAFGINSHRYLPILVSLLGVVHLGQVFSGSYVRPEFHPIGSTGVYFFAQEGILK